jgi:hypothetical protein
MMKKEEKNYISFNISPGISIKLLQEGHKSIEYIKT